MKVARSKLVQYAIAQDLFFARRVGEGSPISRDEFFNLNPSRLIASMYCAIGDDTNGWELEMYNGVNWVVVTPDTSYSLIITNNGLAALTNVKRGGLQLYLSGLKIIGSTVLTPATPITTWTDTQFMQAGEVVFTCGTNGSDYIVDSLGNPFLKRILKWRFNSSSGGLQYILTLPADGFGSTADDGSDAWPIGAIGLYIKDPSDNTTDVLFAVASLPEVITKHATSVDAVGSAIKMYFNTVLTNLGVVSNLEVISEGDVNLPEVQNETLLTYPTDAKKRPYNCYVVDDLYGTNMPALAVQRKLTTTTMEDITSDDDIDWAWFQPSDNFIIVPAESFDSNVANYDFVYWDTTNSLYKQALGNTDSSVDNDKMPIGIRIGNSVVFSGTVTNTSLSYQYEVELVATGADYDVADELLIPVDGNLVFKIEVLALNSSGGISNFRVVGPTAGSYAIPGNPTILPAIYDPRSQLPREGSGARFKLTSTAIPNTEWNFPATWLNKPIYCSNTNPGKVTINQTDSMIGWVIAANSIKLGLDLRNEATTTRFGIVRYATNNEVKEVVTNAAVANHSAVCPSTLQANYLQKSLPTNSSQEGSSLANPVNVDTYVRFSKIVLGKGAVAPYENTTTNPYVDDSNISFYGTAFRAWYQDLAEYYEADEAYVPGTLVCFGGQKEITIAKNECNAVVSTNPGYELGYKLSELHLPIALVGRAPVLFDGNCMPKTFDKVYLSKIKPGCASTVENGKCIGRVIAKSFGTSRLIECVLKIEF